MAGIVLTVCIVKIEFLLPFISFSSHIVTAIQKKAQPCQFFTLQKTGSNSTVVEHFDFTPTLYSMVSTSSF